MLKRLLKWRAGCRAVRPLLWDFAQNALVEAERTRVQAHLARCISCKAEAEAFAKSATALSVYADQPLSPAMLRPARWAEVETRIRSGEEEKQLPAPRRRFSVPVTVGGVAALGALGYVALAPHSTPHVPLATSQASGDSAQLTRMLYTAQKRGVSMYAEPAFLGMTPQGTFPLVVSFGNEGSQFAGKLTIEPQRWDRTTRRFTQELTVPLGRSRFLVYPAYSVNSERDGDGALSDFLVRFNGPRDTWTMSVSTARGGNTYNQVAYIGKGIGVLAPSERTAQGSIRPTRRTLDYTPVYCKPQNAPEIAAGYDAVRTVVLGQGAESLSDVQWKALRDWLVSGGCVVVAGGTNPALLQTPEALALLPANLSTVPLADNAPLPEHTLGLGRVVYLGADWLSHDARNNPGFTTRWNNLLNYQARPIFESRFAYDLADMTPDTQAAQPQTSLNPFELSLPPLRVVTLLFLGYFVLAVPVSFVVLKQTRRMNLAWATGPILAVTFAGATYGLNRSLYKAEQSERTRGALIAQEGETTGRFAGATEFFFRKAGTYTVHIPGAETILDATDMGTVEWYGSQPRTRVARDLTTHSDENGVAVPSMPVTSLAFRSLHHSQGVAFGNGIRTNLHWTTRNGVPTVVGTIENGTGRALRDVWVTNPQFNKPETRWPNGKRKDWPSVAAFMLGDIPQGRQSVRGDAQYHTYYKDLPQLSTSGRLAFQLGTTRNYKGLQGIPREEKPPILVGSTSGAEFGAHLGRDVGGDRSVLVIVGLTQTQGGAK